MVLATSILRLSQMVSGCNSSPFDSCWSACTFQLNYSQISNNAILLPFSLQANLLSCLACLLYQVSSISVNQQTGWGFCDSGFSKIESIGKNRYVQVSWITQQGSPCVTTYYSTSQNSNVLGIGMMYGYDGVYEY